MAITLAADMDAVETTATLNAGHDPVKANDILTIGTEKMKVVSLTGDPAITVARAQSGTTATAHTTGAAITVSSNSTNICAQIAPGGTYPGFIPIPSYVYLGTCSDTGSEPTWEEISNVESITMASPSTALLDVTNLNNPSRTTQQIPGLTTMGDVTLTVNFWPEDPTHDENTGLLHLAHTRETRPYRIVCQYDVSDPTQQFVVTFAGFITGLPLSFAPANAMKLVATIRQTGDRIEETGANVMPVGTGAGGTLSYQGRVVGAPAGRR